MINSEHQIEDIYLFNSEQAKQNIDSHEEQFYVYILVNPINRLPFYVGKGQGERCLSHYYFQDINEDYKSKFLRKLFKKGYEPLYFFFDFYDNEKVAYNAEAKLIHKYGLKIRNKNNLLYNVAEGQGANAVALKQKEIIDSFQETHGDKYDYSAVIYKGANHKVEIVCKEHGSFWQIPRHHHRKEGCEQCNFKNISKVKQAKVSDVIAEFKEVHGSRYDYSLVEYAGTHSKVKIICKAHGEYLQSPKRHKKGHGCRSCGALKSWETRREGE